MREVTDAQRRARLGARHALSRRTGTVAEAVGEMTCLHATEPASVYLSVFARADASRSDIDKALYEERSVVKQLAMRRTLFAFPRDLLPAVWGSASARVLGQLRTRLAKEVESNGLADDGAAWLGAMFDEVLRSLREEGPSTTAELRERIPDLALRLELAPGKKYGGSFPIAPRLLGALAVGGQIVRGGNNGGWHVSRPRWELTEDWMGEPVRHAEPAAGYRILVERWLRTFGPGTEADLVWWLGATKGVVRRALGELGAVEVGLREGVGYLLPDDLADVPEPEPWAALLPVLDPTVMGWKQRGFYLDEEDVPHLFDSNGNAGTTAWWAGRIVGCWVQDDDGVVSVVLRHDIGDQGTRALDAEASRLTEWLDGHRVGTVYTSPLMRSAR
jgi:DNA glycosylase AlkZ-like